MIDLSSTKELLGKTVVSQALTVYIGYEIQCPFHQHWAIKFRASNYSLCTSHTTVSVSGDDEELDQPGVIPAAPLINQQSNALLSEPPPFKDIGNLLEPTKSIDTTCQSVSDLSNEAKHSLLCHHIAPPSSLPTTSRGCNRKFNITWLTKWLWLLYSPKLDGVSCGPCSLFLSGEKRKDKGLLVNRPCSNWSKIGSAFEYPLLPSISLGLLQYPDILENSMDTPASCIAIMVSSDIQMRMDENKQLFAK